MPYGKNLSSVAVFQVSMDCPCNCGSKFYLEYLIRHLDGERQVLHALTIKTCHCQIEPETLAAVTAERVQLHAANRLMPA